ncbi:MAG: response regulator transcription factor [Blastocatellia bacterium]
MRVLIAEDDPISRAFLQKLLEKLGHTVTACVSGTDAWNAYKTEDFRLVVSDWMMPGMDGIELCRAIRKANRSTYCYFIMVTARTAKSDFVEAMNAGADDCLTKPLCPDEIAVRLIVAQRILALITKLAVTPFRVA